MIIRIQKATISHFRNVERGEIQFPCNLNTDIFSPQADILGIYGQNGSGKTTFIFVLNILKNILSGKAITKDLTDCISNISDSGTLEFEFSIFDQENNKKYRIIYAATISKTGLQESLKMSTFEDSKWSRLNSVFSCDIAEKETLGKPASKVKEIFGTESNMLDDLRVTKMICAKEHRSFIFAPETIKILKDRINKHADSTVIPPWIALNRYGLYDLFVITNRTTGLISLDAGLPVSFRTSNALGRLILPLDEPTVIPEALYKVSDHVIATINQVLCEIIPGMQIALAPLGNELMENGEKGIRVQLARAASRISPPIPLKYESEGIKKIISILDLLIVTYNNPSITLVVDELDSGIFEYLLGELLSIMQKGGRGQLVFTSHNLHPLETLTPSSIIFTTTNPQNRYVRMTIKGSNNLRRCYMREVALGSTKEELYEETSSIEIAHAMRKVGYLNKISQKDEA